MVGDTYQKIYCKDLAHAIVRAGSEDRSGRAGWKSQAGAEAAVHRLNYPSSRRPYSAPNAFQLFKLGVLSISGSVSLSCRHLIMDSNHVYKISSQ